MLSKKASKFESIFVELSPEETPVAYNNRVECLMRSGLSEEIAKRTALDPIELEVFYEVGKGLFAVEGENVKYGSVASPYSGEYVFAPDDEE